MTIITVLEYFVELVMFYKKNKKKNNKKNKQDISPSILSFKTMLQTYPIPRHVSVIQGMSIQDHLKDMWTNFHANTDADAQ